MPQFAPIWLRKSILRGALSSPWRPVISLFCHLIAGLGPHYYSTPAYLSEAQASLKLNAGPLESMYIAMNNDTLHIICDYINKGQVDLARQLIELERQSLKNEEIRLHIELLKQQNTTMSKTTCEGDALPRAIDKASTQAHTGDSVFNVLAQELTRASIEKTSIPSCISCYVNNNYVVTNEQLAAQWIKANMPDKGIPANIYYRIYLRDVIHITSIDRFNDLVAETLGKKHEYKLAGEWRW